MAYSHRRIFVELAQMLTRREDHIRKPTVARSRSVRVAFGMSHADAPIATASAAVVSRPAMAHN